MSRFEIQSWCLTREVRKNSQKGEWNRTKECTFTTHHNQLISSLCDILKFKESKSKHTIPTYVQIVVSLPKKNTKTKNSCPTKDTSLNKSVITYQSFIVVIKFIRCRKYRNFNGVLKCRYHAWTKKVLDASSGQVVVEVQSGIFSLWLKGGN